MSGERDVRPVAAGTRAGTGDDLVDFLRARLTEELTLLWERDAGRGDQPRPGLASQVAVLDELLVDLRAGRLPARRDLRILLHCYGTHPAYDPRWSGRLDEAG